MTKRFTTKLFVIFAALYFVQGVGEVGAGLLAQPVRSLLRNWGRDTEQIATFMFLLGLPWYIKPVFGLLTDFVPIAGLRRKSYLVLSASLMVLGFVIAAILPLTPALSTVLLISLLLPSIGIASKDVATDAIMVETGQPLGITGRLQSAQWGAIYFAGLLTGVAGGWISQYGYQRLGFVICAVLGCVSLYIGLFQIKEERQPALKKGLFKRAIKILGEAARTRMVVLVAVFTLFVNFNPFSADVLYVHMTNELGFSEQFVGYTYTVSSLAAIVAAILYGLFAKHVPLSLLLHGSVIFMILSKIVYLGLGTESSAIAISLAFGFAYMITTLTQLELASRYCPPAAAGTVFALLMSLSNFSVSLSSIVGGKFYEAWKVSLGTAAAYDRLVIMGTGITVACWLLVLFFPKNREDPALAG